MDKNPPQKNGKSPISSSGNLDAKELSQHDYIFPIERIQKQIPIPSNFPVKEQSLLQMFNAELFTTEYLIEYLYKKFEQVGVHEYLVNKLYAVPHYEMDFYISFIVCFGAFKHFVKAVNSSSLKDGKKELKSQKEQYEFELQIKQN